MICFENPLQNNVRFRGIEHFFFPRALLMAITSDCNFMKRDNNIFISVSAVTLAVKTNYRWQELFLIG